MLRIPAILTSQSLTHDGGMRLGFTTQEMSVSDKLEATENYDKFGYLLFSPNPISDRDIPTAQAEDKSKTPSKRLRAVLYLLYIQQGGKKETFEAFYMNRMELLIDQIKAKLDQ